MITIASKSSRWHKIKTRSKLEGHPITMAVILQLFCIFGLIEILFMIVWNFCSSLFNPIIGELFGRVNLVGVCIGQRKKTGKISGVIRKKRENRIE